MHKRDLLCNVSVSGFPLFVHCTIYIVAMNEQQKQTRISDG